MLILLVRRNMKALEQLKNLVRQCYPNSEILTFTDGSKALESAEAERLTIDLCFVDVKLPAVTGLGLASRLRERDRRTKAVLIADTGAYCIDAWRIGANDYLLEPVTLESVRHTVESCAPFISSYQAPTRRICES